jgi:hypothetical protein
MSRALLYRGMPDPHDYGADPPAKHRFALLATRGKFQLWENEQAVIWWDRHYRSEKPFDCGHTINEQYCARLSDRYGRTLCSACATDHLIQYMHTAGRAVLYCRHRAGQYEITTWDGAALPITAALENPSRLPLYLWRGQWTKEIPFLFEGEEWSGIGLGHRNYLRWRLHRAKER